MRQRAISAAVLVPVLLVVLFFGGVVLAAAVALITVLAAMEAFKLLKGAGYTPFASLGMVLALVVVLEAIDRDLDKRGLVDGEGNARSMLDHRARISRQLERWLGDFGATPASRASWAEAVARGETLLAVLQTELERGRKLRERADRRRTLNGGGDHG